MLVRAEMFDPDQLLNQANFFVEDKIEDKLQDIYMGLQKSL